MSLSMITAPLLYHSRRIAARVPAPNLWHFRVRSGKGAKPAKVSMTEFAEVTELLRDTVEAVEAAAERLG